MSHAVYNDGSFLYSLVDTSGKTFHFGIEPVAQRNVFHFDVKGKGKHANDTIKYITIFKGNELRPIHSGRLPRNNVSPDWFFPIILLVLAVFAWLRIFYNKYYSQMIKAFLNSNLANQIVRDENIFVQRASIYLSIVFNLVAALLLYLFSIHYHWELGGIGSGFNRFAFFVILVSAGYAVKFLVLKMCGWLFDQEREMGTYIFNIFLINNILGMALLPFICIIAYNETISVSWLMILPLLLITVAFIWRIFRGIQIGIGATSFSPLYLFLYLCTLEITPLMILVRIIVQ